MFSIYTYFLITSVYPEAQSSQIEFCKAKLRMPIIFICLTSELLLWYDWIIFQVFECTLKVFKSKNIIILIDFSYFFSSFSFPGEQNHTKQIQHDSTESYLGHTPHQYWGKFHLLICFEPKSLYIYESRDEPFS